LATKTNKKAAKSPQKSTGKKPWSKKIIRFLLYAVLGFFILSIGSVLVYKWVPVPGTPLMIFRMLEKREKGSAPPVRHTWVSIEKISPHLQLAVVCSEDQNFLKHAGFDWGAIEKARKENKKGKRLRGASTISQQTAKNVFLWHGRNYLRKGLEAWFTFLIELFWSKERIMEVYLNSIEMGDGIYGAEAASRAYFNKSAADLTREEAALIAAILPNPRRYSAKNPGSYTRGRQLHILNQMRLRGGKLNYDKYKDGLPEKESKPRKSPPKKSHP
jgi:monofunctional biosynthetic peptidoglycan transglycosylase